MQNQDLKIAPDVKPVYADEASVNANLKVNVEKNDDGSETFRKSGKIEVLFLDHFVGSVVQRAVLDPFTAKALGKILVANADKMIEELEKEGVPENVQEQIKAQENAGGNPSVNTYIG